MDARWRLVARGLAHCLSPHQPDRSIPRPKDAARHERRRRIRLTLWGFACQQGVLIREVCRVPLVRAGIIVQVRCRAPSSRDERAPREERQRFPDETPSSSLRPTADCDGQRWRAAMANNAGELTALVPLQLILAVGC